MLCGAQKEKKKKRKSKTYPQGFISYGGFRMWVQTPALRLANLDTLIKSL